MNSKLTDFADYTDLVAFIKKASTFLTQAQIQECLAVGDNGVGASGKTTATDTIPMVALPAQEMKNKWGSTTTAWGKLVRVTFEGVSKEGQCQDISPPGVCDMNPAMLKSMNLKHPFSGQGTWDWVS